MSRRHRKKEAARAIASAPTPQPVAKPALPARSWEDFVLGPGGMVDRIVRMGAGRDLVLRALATAAARLCRESGSPGYDANYFFVCLGEQLALDARLVAEPSRFERSDTALRSGFYRAQLRELERAIPLTAEDRRILLQWKN
jgi:hypothetical protein